MLGKVELLFLMQLIVLFGYTQQLPDRMVFSTAGKNLKNANISAPAAQQKRLTFTMGEPIIGLGSNSGKRMFNGFIQPDGIFPISPPGPVILPQINTFEVYPNPTDESVKIIAPAEWDSNINIQLIDLQGKLVMQFKTNEKVFQLNFEETIVPGNYFLNFYYENGVFIQQTKLIKQNNQ